MIWIDDGLVSSREAGRLVPVARSFPITVAAFLPGTTTPGHPLSRTVRSRNENKTTIGIDDLTHQFCSTQPLTSPAKEDCIVHETLEVARGSWWRST